MIWPQGAFLQEARIRALGGFTPKVKANHHAWVPLTDWRKYSSLQVTSVSGKSIELICNRNELHGTLVGEVEAWSDHEMEMRAQVLRSSVTTGRSQESWFLVETYYWAVFSACLLMRILGRPIFRMSASDCETLVALTSGSEKISEGTYKLVQGDDVSLTSRAVSLVKLKSNYHQSLWSGLASELSDLHKRSVKSNPNQLESEIISHIMSVLGGNSGFMSDIRNMVNYRSEAAFFASTKGFGFSVVQNISACHNMKPAELLLNLSNSALLVKGVKKSSTYEQAAGEFSFWCAVSLSLLAQSLYKEVSAATSFDSSWIRRRIAFGESDMGVPKDLRSWLPFAKPD